MQGAQPAPVAGTGTGTEAAAVDDAPDYGFELQLAERDLFVAAALFKRLAFEHNCLNEIVTNKSFPEAVAQSVLGQFRAFEEKHKLLELRRSVAAICKHCAAGDVAALEVALRDHRKLVKTAQDWDPRSLPLSPVAAAKGNADVLSLLKGLFVEHGPPTTMATLPSSSDNPAPIGSASTDNLPSLDSDSNPPAADSTLVVPLHSSTLWQHEPQLRDALTRALRPDSRQDVVTFERAFAQLCGTVHCVSAGSGLDAMWLLLAALDVGPGHDVLLPANAPTHIALAVLAAGATPVLVDAQLDVAAMEAAVTPRTKALISVPLSLEAMQPVAVARALPLLLAECTHANGALLQRAHAACFCFAPNTVPGVLSDGGAILTNDDALATKLRDATDRCSGRLLDPLQAALLAAQLPSLPSLTAARALVASAYTAALSALSWLTLAGAEATMPQYVVHCEHRDGLRAHLLERGVQCAVLEAPLHLQPAFRHLGVARGALPAAERLACTALGLPVDGVTQQQLAHVIASVEAFPASPHWPR